jgi:hypothetical protein
MNLLLSAKSLPQVHEGRQFIGKNATAPHGRIGSNNHNYFIQLNGIIIIIIIIIIIKK